MKAVIPMAGFGKRLRPHTFSKPKPLLNVAGEPMLKHILDTLAEVDIDEYIFIVGYLGDQIEAYIQANFQFKATFVVQNEMIGQSHAIHLAREHISGPCLVLFADTLFQTDLAIIQSTDADAIAFTKEVDDPRRFGVVELNSDGQVTRFIEKPATTDNKQVVIGLYYVRNSAAMLKAIDQQMAQAKMLKGEYFIADAFQIMVQNGAVFRTQPIDVWLDCGKPETVLETNRYLLDHGHDTSDQTYPASAAIVPPVHIHPSATLENCVIGPYATIAANCHIRDSVIRNSVIDAGAEVVEAILDQSLIGSEARITGHYRQLNIGDESSLIL